MNKNHEPILITHESRTHEPILITLRVLATSVEVSLFVLGTSDKTEYENGVTTECKLFTV